jgi:hypothetical protein
MIRFSVPSRFSGLQTLCTCAITCNRLPLALRLANIYLIDLCEVNRIHRIRQLLSANKLSLETLDDQFQCEEEDERRLEAESYTSPSAPAQ